MHNQPDQATQFGRLSHLGRLYQQWVHKFTELDITWQIIYTYLYV
jgi:hypothetical protein